MKIERGMDDLGNQESEFSRLYHAHHARHMEDLPFWIELADACRGPVLELGCGTGRVLLNLARTGHRVIGLDLDAGMLTVLQENMPDNLRARVNVLRGDFTHFHLAFRFNLILLPCNTYSTLSSVERSALLSCVARHLAPEGVFVASLPNPVLLRQLPSYGSPEVEEVFPHPDDGSPVQVTSSWKRAAQGVTIYWDYDYILQGREQHLSHAVHHHRATVQNYLAELHEKGFELVTLYGDYDLSTYYREAQNLIIVAGFQALT